MNTREGRTHIQRTDEKTFCGLRARYLVMAVGFESATCHNCTRMRRLELKRLAAKVIKLAKERRR